MGIGFVGDEFLCQLRDLCFIMFYISHDFVGASTIGLVVQDCATIC